MRWTLTHGEALHNGLVHPPARFFGWIYLITTGELTISPPSVVPVK